MHIPAWTYIVSMTTYIVFLLFFISFMRKHYKLSMYFFLFSLLTFPLWLKGGVIGWFRWAKILSVILPTIVVGITRISVYEKRKGRFWEFFQKEWTLWFFYAILFLNIMEATIKDVTLGNYFNAFCGFLLCVTIPFAPKFWEISKEPYGDLIAYTTAAWNFIYTSWNACFVYAESPVHFFSSVCILLAAEIYPIIKGRPELYIIARVYTLAIHLLLRACWDIFPKVMDASPFHNTQVLKIWGIINAIMIIPYVFWHMWQLHTGKADISFRRGRLKSV